MVCQCKFLFNEFGFCVFIYYLVLNVDVTTCKTGEMRLVGGSVHNEGQMEICINGVWGAVCLYYWNSFTSKLICKQLGYQEYGNNNCIV